MDPAQGEPHERHPWVLKFEAVPFERFALEGAAGNGGAGFGLVMALYDQNELGVDMSVGFDELFFAPQEDLFGIEPEELTSRVWMGAARSWKWARLRSSVAVMSIGEHVEYIPFASAEALLPGHSAIGWETSYSHHVWRNHLGASLGWEPFILGFGLTEVQSWFFRNGEAGWFNAARSGSATGFDNPGWWFSVGFTLPHFEKPPPPVVVAQGKGPMSLDTADLRRLETMFVERQVRADLAELALRLEADGVDPLESGALRRRILSGGPAARSALWNIAVDGDANLQERIQAIATVSGSVDERDLPALEALTEEASPRLRAEVALALGRSPSPKAKALLQRLRNDPEGDVRDAANAASGGR